MRTVASVERQRHWGAADAREGGELDKRADFLPPPDQQPPSRVPTGRTSRKPDWAGAVCRGETGFLGHRAGWKMDQRDKEQPPPRTLPGGG